MRNSDASRPPADKLGRLCREGTDVAAYLYQVPDDAGQRQRLGEILDAIVREAGTTNARELPKIATELKGVLVQPPSPARAALFQDGFDRMNKLWASARSGIF